MTDGPADACAHASAGHRQEAPAGSDAAELDLTCYVYPGWRPRIRAASSRREWMDGTPDSFAYRCLPLNIANAHGWELLSPCGFEAEWNGGPGVNDVVVRPDPGTPEADAPVALFGQGVVTFHVQGLFRTPPGFNLWIGGPPNAAKDGLAPLSGLIETDWSSYTFTMNWRFTRPGQVIRFEENEPFCFLFPVERALSERVRPRLAPIEEAPELKRKFEAWSASRDAFQAKVAAEPPKTTAGSWQKAYYRGVDPEGVAGAADHQSKLRLAEFAGAELHTRAAAKDSCPAHRPASPPPPEGPSADKYAWMLNAQQRLRALSPDQPIPRMAAMSPEAFRDQHYAANWPVALNGALADWPAVRRWSPDYLKAKIGSAPVQVQANRNADAEYERRMAHHVETMGFDAFLDRILAPGAGNDCYMTASNAAANVQALSPLAADLGTLDAYLTNGEGSAGMLWIGPAGAFTPLHYDLTNNLLLQIVGRKRVLLAAPAETPKLYNDQGVYSRIRDLGEPGIVERFPRLEGLRVHQVILNPGDALFIPLGWWHQALAQDFSVTATHTNFRWPNDFYEDYPGS